MINTCSFYVSKQNQETIKVSDVWVSESVGCEMIIFIQYQICARNFSNMLSVGYISVPNLQMKTRSNQDNRRYVRGRVWIWTKSNNDSLCWLQQLFTSPNGRVKLYFFMSVFCKIALSGFSTGFCKRLCGCILVKEEELVWMRRWIKSKWSAQQIYTYTGTEMSWCWIWKALESSNSQVTGRKPWEDSPSACRDWLSKQDAGAEGMLGQHVGNEPKGKVRKS